MANPINRYLINSPMLPELKENPDGSLTLYIQKDPPGPTKESNWLPAPDGSNLPGEAPLLAEGNTTFDSAAQGKAPGNRQA